MNTHYLLPKVYRKYGIVLFILQIAIYLFIDLIKSDLSPILNVKLIGFLECDKNFIFSRMLDISKILFIAGTILCTFSKQKNEDEFMSKIRLESLLWAFYLYFAIFIVSAIINYFYKISTNDGNIGVEVLLLIFLFRFFYIQYKNKYLNENPLKNEE